MPGAGWTGALVWLSLATLTARAQITVNGRVTDENGVAVAGARIEAVSSSGAAAVAESNDAGHFVLELSSAGNYRLLAERVGFFVFREKSVEFSEGANHLAITLNHLQELAESMEVAYSPPAIDYQQPAERKELASVEILNVPYPASQDLRNALPLMDGVVQDASGQVHVEGGASDQTNYMLDGFNITNPYTGRYEARVSIDGVRSLELETARFSAEKGRGSAGSLDIKTGMGDDRWRFSGTNFIPGVSSQSGLMINKWTPRVTVSGPIVKSRAWFYNAFDAFYGVDVISGLPKGEDRSRSFSGSDLSRVQVNVTPGNILTGSFLANYGDDARHGLSFLDPAETTVNRRLNFYMTSVKDQWYLGNGALLEVGFADSRSAAWQRPQGDETFQISPFGRRGNYFVDAGLHTSRQQWLGNVFLPAFTFHGSHQLKLGVDLQQSAFERTVDRHGYEILRTDLSVARFVTFAGAGLLHRENFEISQYVQDRWTPVEGILIEAGLRMDWDQVLRHALMSPRLLVAYAPKWLRDTKLSAGVGVFHDALTLSTLTQNQDQVSLSTFFPPGGIGQRGPVETAFAVNEHALQAPRYRSASFTAERKLPFDFFGRAAYSHRVGSRGFTFVNELAPPGGGLYQLRNWRHDRWDAAEFSIRRTFKGKYEWVAGYTRSSARSDAVIDYSLENPIFAAQGSGPVAWDAPNRFLTWGWVPLETGALPGMLRSAIGDTNVVYLAEYRTGFPFSVVNEEGYLVGDPNSRRLPSYFNINLHFERRFHFREYLWAWRFGLNNLTNSGNPNVVNNNVDSPAFLVYGRGQARAFAVRLRFLGRR